MFLRELSSITMERTKYFVKSVINGKEENGIKKFDNPAAIYLKALYLLYF